jgi:hypothetical protein
LVCGQQLLFFPCVSGYNEPTGMGQASNLEHDRVFVQKYVIIFFAQHKWGNEGQQQQQQRGDQVSLQVFCSSSIEETFANDRGPPGALYNYNNSAA